MEYTFTLKYALPLAEADKDALVERLGAQGCTDATIVPRAARLPGRGVHPIRQQRASRVAIGIDRRGASDSAGRFGGDRR